MLCHSHVNTYEGAMAVIDKGEHRLKGKRKMHGVHVCLDCAETNPQVLKYKIIFLTGWKYPKKVENKP